MSAAGSARAGHHRHAHRRHPAIDNQDRIRVSNGVGSSVIRFHVSAPAQVEKFDAGCSGIAIDSQGNVRRADRFGSSEPGRAKLDAMLAACIEWCGVRSEHCPPGMKTGEAISPQGGYVGGGMRQPVDIGIGPAGDVRLTDNWDIDAAAFGQASEVLGTQGAGQGVVVFCGMAKPVKRPLTGPPRAP